MVWNPWSVVPQVSEEQRKKWEDIPSTIFWTKLSILLAIAFGLLTFFILIINN